MSFLNANPQYAAKERRTGYERRVSEDLCYFRNGGIERRGLVDRRQGIPPVKPKGVHSQRRFVKLVSWLFQ